MLGIVDAIVSTSVVEGNAAAKEQVSQTTFTTRPLRIQRVQTRIFLTWPLTWARIFLRFGSQRRLVRLWA